MQSKAATVSDYLAGLPEDRRTALEGLLKVIRKNIDKKTEEGMQYGMIGFYIPHKVYPPGYHCDPKQPLPFLGLASQKNHMSLYLFCEYVQDNGNSSEQWFRTAWAATGKKLDMGKSCIRFKKLDDLALDVIAEALRRLPVKEHIANYESVLARSKSRPAAAKKTTAKAAKTAKAPKK